MSFFSGSFRNPKAGSSQPFRRRLARFRPWLAVLEDRCVPSQIFTVNSAGGDPLGPTVGVTTLRDAINAVNADREEFHKFSHPVEGALHLRGEEGLVAPSKYAPCQHPLCCSAMAPGQLRPFTETTCG
jgi:hypothetical protein